MVINRRNPLPIEVKFMAYFVVPFRVLALLLAISFPFALSAASSLAWENPMVEIQAAPLEEHVDVVFHFTNQGSARVNIISTAASCGCTVPQLEKKVYAPGETGALHAIYTPGDRVGPQAEQVIVTTDEPGGSPQPLLFKVTVPKLYDVSSYFVIWNGGEKPEIKTISLHLSDPRILFPLGVSGEDPRVFAKLESDPTSSANYSVRIHPLSTATAFTTSLVVELASPTGRKRAITLYVVVRGAPPKAP
jgi:uncharacterized protein DUF1573